MTTFFMALGFTVNYKPVLVTAVNEISEFPDQFQVNDSCSASGDSGQD